MFTELDYGILTTEYVRTHRYQPRTLRAVAGRYAWRPACRNHYSQGIRNVSLWSSSTAKWCASFSFNLSITGLP